MGLGSFLPKRDGSRRPLHPEVPTTADHGSDAPTEVSPAWSALLHRHLTAQDNPPVGPTQQVTDPRTVSNTVSGPATDPSAPTAVFPKIAKPGPNHFPPYVPRIPPPKPYMARPNNPLPEHLRTPHHIHHQQLPNPTDINATIAYAESLKNPITKRVLRYVLENGGIGVAVAHDIHRITGTGVWITERGMSPGTRKLIPWSAVRSLEMDEKDELYGS